MLAILWTYDGWSDVGAIAGEIEEPQKNIPRVYFLGTVSVTAALRRGERRLHLARAAARDEGPRHRRAARHASPARPAAAAAVTAIIVVSTIGSSHASVLTGARVTFAQARDGLLFRFLGRIHPRYETPAVALWLQLALSCVALWHPAAARSQRGEPVPAARRRFTFTMWIFYGLAAIAIFVLRVQGAGRAAPVPLLGLPGGAWRLRAGERGHDGAHGRGRRDRSGFAGMEHAPHARDPRRGVPDVLRVAAVRAV
jgi:APA family basic amino acid/polyamine antiporter